MKTEMIRRNQKLVDEAYQIISNASCEIVLGIKTENIAPGHQVYLDENRAIDIDMAIKLCHKGLAMLYQLQDIRDENVTVNLSEPTNGMVESDTPLLDAGESPVIRSLPETEQIKPLLRMPTSSHAVPLEI